MPSPRQNRIYVTLFLAGVVVFTGLMTFYYGTRMMALRESVEEGKLLFKCQKIVDGNTVELQLRSWQRPNTNALIRVRLAGMESPPLGKPDDEAVRAWAEAHGLDAGRASRIGVSAEQALRAFARKQNVVIEQADGLPVSGDLAPDTPVHLFVSGTLVNLKQLKHGLALHDRDHPHAHQELYAQAEASARAQRLGLWAGKD